MSDIIGQILIIILVIFGATFVGLGMFVWKLKKDYRHTIIIKNNINGSKLVQMDKFKIIKKSDDSVWWKLQKLKKEIIPAPQPCIEVDDKGSMFVSYYRLDGDTFIPSRDGFDYSNKDTRKKIIDEVQPYTTEQRAISVSQHLKSLRDKTSTLGEKILAAVPVLAVIMILIIFMLFFNDAVKPIKEVGDQFVAVSNNLVKASDKFDNILHDKVHIYDEEELLDGAIVGDEPPN